VRQVYFSPLRYSGIRRFCHFHMPQELLWASLTYDFLGATLSSAAVGIRKTFGNNIDLFIIWVPPHFGSVIYSTPSSHYRRTMFFPPSSLVLGNRDLLDIIFDFFWPHEHDVLLAASLTCKAFLEPALNAIWRKMQNIKPLCCLLPTFDKDTCVG